MADIVPIFATLVPNLFHHNNVGITYAGTSNFKMEPLRSVPLYSMAMPRSMVIVNEAPFTTTPTHTNYGMRSKPHTPRGIDLVSIHTQMLTKVYTIFVGQPLDPGEGGSGPPRPSRYFGLPMVNQSKPNMFYH
jgi:hypothetical protein